MPTDLDRARAAHFKFRRRYQGGYRFKGRFTSTDGIEFYEWERRLPGDSRVEIVTAPVTWFWAGARTYWRKAA